MKLEKGRWPKERQSIIEYNPIAESNHFIILEMDNREWIVAESYQREGNLEREHIVDLQNQDVE